MVVFAGKYWFACKSITAILFKINTVCYLWSNGCNKSAYLLLLLFNTIKLPSKGICREVIGIASLTLCWNTVSESSTVTPEIVSLHYHCFCSTSSFVLLFCYIIMELRITTIHCLSYITIWENIFLYKNTVFIILQKYC